MSEEDKIPNREIRVCSECNRAFYLRERDKDYNSETCYDCFFNNLFKQVEDMLDELNKGEEWKDNG